MNRKQDVDAAVEQHNKSLIAPEGDSYRYKVEPTASQAALHSSVHLRGGQ